MATHARATRSWSRRSTVALGVVALLGVGTSIGYAAQTSASSTIRACYKTKGGALTFRSAGHTCPSGTKPLSWNAKGPTGPAGVSAAYVGQAHYGGVGKKIPDSASATLVAETPKLKSGVYIVSSAAQIRLAGISELQCFLSIVSIHPTNDGHSGLAQDTDFPDFLDTTIAVDDTFRGLAKDDRIGFYCSNLGESVDTQNFSAVHNVDLNAIHVESVAITKVT